jgi:hypothetical protein
MQVYLIQNAKAIVASLAVVTVAFVGGLLGHLLGSPKTFFVIALGMLIWLGAGWFFGGWRAVLAGLLAFGAALMASEATYAVAIAFSCAALALLFADVSPRESRISHSPSH